MDHEPLQLYNGYETLIRDTDITFSSKNFIADFLIPRPNTDDSEITS